MRRRARRIARRAGMAVGAAALVATVWAVPSQAQTDPPPENNFSLAGIQNLSTGQSAALDTYVTGDFAFCNNLNGLGAELYFNGTDAAGTTVEHATVTPFVVPLHIGILKVHSADPANPLDNEGLTVGLAKGDTVEFGQSGVATAEYGGLFFGNTVGMVSWNYSASVTCTESIVMPILQPFVDAGTTTTTAPGGTTTTTAPATTTTTTASTTTTTTTSTTTTTTLP
jgi:hypothetical protein